MSKRIDVGPGGEPPRRRRMPEPEGVWDRLTLIVGVALNLLSVLARAFSWRLTINQALPLPHPRFSQVFSAFGIGLLGNAVLPASLSSRLASLAIHCAMAMQSRASAASGEPSSVQTCA